MKIKYILLLISLLSFSFSQCENPDETEYYIECGGGILEEQVIWALSPGNLHGGAPYSERLDITLPDNYVINMFDSWGDGWNGNIMEIDGDFTANGEDILTIAMG